METGPGKAGLLLGAFAAAAIALYAFVFNSSGALSPENMRSALLSLGIAGPLIYIAVIAFAVIVVPIPSIPFVLVAGYVYGPAAALAFTVTGGTLGSLAAFFLARKLGRERVKKWLSKIDTINILDRFDTKLGFIAVLATRLTPLISFDIVSYAAGLTNISAGKFAIATALGMVPLTAGYAMAGSAAFELDLFHLAAAALALLALFGAAWLFRGRIKRATGIDLESAIGGRLQPSRKAY